MLVLVLVFKIIIIIIKPNQTFNQMITNQKSYYKLKNYFQFFFSSNIAQLKDPLIKLDLINI